MRTELVKFGYPLRAERAVGWQFVYFKFCVLDMMKRVYKKLSFV